MKSERTAAKVFFSKKRRYITLVAYALILFVLGLWMLAEDADFAYVELLCSLAIVVFEFISIRKSEKDFLKYIEQLDFCTNDNSRGLLMNYPGPLVITDMAGEINWYNDKFGEVMSGAEETYGRLIQEFVPEIQIGRFPYCRRAGAASCPPVSVRRTRRP